MAAFNDFYLTDLVSVATSPDEVTNSGHWVIAQSFELDFRGFQFATKTIGAVPASLYESDTPKISLTWESSLTKEEFEEGVRSIRSDIERGWVYQVNLCRVMSSVIGRTFIDPIALFTHLQKLNPAPYAGALRCFEHEVAITSASPELFFSLDQNEVLSRPIKGTATSETDLLPKDYAENVMIVDLVRNDISAVAIPGSVQVPKLLALESHPGLVHLVSDVSGALTKDAKLSDLLDALAPAGSVSGAPKSSALEVINRLEPVARNIYCGAFGWFEPLAGQASIAVGIRTFWQTRSDDLVKLNFGTGAGITYDSDPALEWQETVLKSAKLVAAVADFVEG